MFKFFYEERKKSSAGFVMRLQQEGKWVKWGQIELSSSTIESTYLKMLHTF